MQARQSLGIRWTVGNLRGRGFEMLRLSIACAFRVFGRAASYVVCVNSLSAEEARLRTGSLPLEVEWREITVNDISGFLRPHINDEMAEGACWKLIPLRMFPDCHELAMDNDCMLWNLPAGLMQWLRNENRCLIAEDVERKLGIFDQLCPAGCQNSGIRGLPPGFDLQAAIEAVLAAHIQRSNAQVHLTSELDEQGLQTAAVSWEKPAFMVRTFEVSICSPFWPRSLEFGSCGAHFVGMNARHLPWNYYGRPADSWMDEHWLRKRRALYEIAGLQPPKAITADRSTDGERENK